MIAQIHFQGFILWHSQKPKHFDSIHSLQLRFLGIPFDKIWLETFISGIAWLHVSIQAALGQVQKVFQYWWRRGLGWWLKRWNNLLQIHLRKSTRGWWPRWRLEGLKDFWWSLMNFERDESWQTHHQNWWTIELLTNETKVISRKMSQDQRSNRSCSPLLNILCPRATVLTYVEPTKNQVEHKTIRP